MDLNLLTSLDSTTAKLFSDTEYYLMPALFGLDEYGGCLRQDGGTYCLARFELFADSSNTLMTLINVRIKFYTVTSE